MSELGYLEVKNFEQFQHYKQRNPPWIKLHAALLDDYEFARLPNGLKYQLVAIWILASKTGNRIPADPAWIAARIGSTEAIDVEALVASGFVRRLRRASDVQASDKQMPIPSREEERRGEAEERTSATQTGKPAENSIPGLDRGQLLGLIRKCCAPRKGKVSDDDMRKNASIVDRLADRKWTYAEIGHAVVGTQMRRDRGEIPSIPSGAGWSMRYLYDATPDVDPMQVGLNAYHAAAGKPPPPDPKRGGVTGIADVLDFTKFERAS